MSSPGTLRFGQVNATPSPPPSGYDLIYVKTDDVLYIQDSEGVEVPIGSASAITGLTGDVSASGPGVVTSTVNSVGGQTAANIASSTVTVGAATSTDSPNTLVKRDGSGNFASNIVSLEALKLLGSTSGTLTVTVPSTFTSYSLTFPNSTGSTGQALTTDGTGILSWSSTLTTSLADGKIFVGNVSNLAIPQTPSGDISMTDSGDFTVEKIQGFPVSSTAPTDAEFLVWNSSIPQYIPVSLSGDVTMTDTGVTTLSSTGVTDKLLTGYVTGTDTPINAGDSILTAFENLQAQISATGGTVTSVGLSLPSIFTVTVSPITSSGTLTAILNTESVNTVFAGPASGGSATPTFRSLVSSDIPNNAANTTGTAANITATTNSTLTSLPNLSITGTQIDGFTEGSVIFAGASGQLTQDNSEFYWNDVTFNLGLGVIPATNIALDIVNTNGTSKAIQTTSYGAGSTIPFRGRFARGTSGSPTAAQSGDDLSVLSGRGYGTSQFAAASTGAINIVAGETFTNTSNATYLQFEVTPTSSVTLTEAMRLNSTGNLLIGTTTDSGQKLQVNGTSLFSSTVTDSVAPIFSSLTGYLYGNASSAVTASTTIPFTAISGTTTVAQTTIPAQALTESGGATTINWALSDMFTLTLNANLTISFSNASSGQAIVIRLTNTASNYTVTWPGTVKWPVQTAPVMTIGAFSDVYTIIYDGTNYYGSYVQNF